MSKYKVVRSPNSTQVKNGSLTNSGDSSGEYTLPRATSYALGGVKAELKTINDIVPVRVDGDGFLWSEQAETPETYTLPKATPTELGGVKVKTSTPKQTTFVGIDANGLLKVEPPKASDPYVLPKSTETDLGGVKVKPAVSTQTDFVGIDSSGMLKVNPTPELYELPQATQTILGGVKVIPSTIDQTAFVGVDSNGLLRTAEPSSGGGVSEPYVLPTASEFILGGVMAPTALEEQTERVGIDESGYLVTKPEGELPYVPPLYEDSLPPTSGLLPKDIYTADGVLFATMGEHSFSSSSYSMLLSVEADGSFEIQFEGVIKNKNNALGEPLTFADIKDTVFVLPSSTDAVSRQMATAFCAIDTVVVGSYTPVTVQIPRGVPFTSTHLDSVVITDEDSDAYTIIYRGKFNPVELYTMKFYEEPIFD